MKKNIKTKYKYQVTDNFLNHTIHKKLNGEWAREMVVTSHLEAIRDQISKTLRSYLGKPMSRPLDYQAIARQINTDLTK